MIKQLFLPFTNNRLATSLFTTIFFRSALTLLLILFGIFFYVDVIASVVNLLYFSVSIWYIFAILRFILIYGVLSFFRLYYIQFKEVKVLWGRGIEGRVWGPGAGGRITQTPPQNNIVCTYFYGFENSKWGILFLKGLHNIKHTKFKSLRKTSFAKIDFSGN